MKIDAHQHYWSINRGDYGWITPELPVLYRDYLPADLEPHLAKHKLSGSVVVQAAPTLEESLYILQLAEQEPSILGVVGWVDIFSDEHEAQFAQLSQYKKLSGIRIMIQDMNDSSLLLKPEVLKNIGFYVEKNIPLDLLIRSHQLEPIVSLLQAFPTMKAVIDHIGKPDIASFEWENWAVHMQKIAQFDNVYCKLSGMVTEADHKSWSTEQFKAYIKQVLNWFGYSCVMFGSDWPVCLLAASYDEVVHIVEAALPEDLSKRDYEQLFGLNAAAFYNLRSE